MSTGRATSILLLAGLGLAFPAVGLDDVSGTIRKVEPGARRGLFPSSGAARPAAPAVDSVADFAVYPARPRAGNVVSFLDRSTGAPTSWEWLFGDGGTSTDRHPSHTYAKAGAYNVTLRIRGPGGALEVERLTTVSAKDTGTGSTMTYLLPVVLTASGQGGTRFSTELTLTNQSAAALSATFTARGRSGDTDFEESATFSVPPGQTIQPDVWVFLKSIGMKVPAGDPIGTLRVAVQALADLSQFGAQVRVTTPPNQALLDAGIRGRFGLAFTATPLTYSADGVAVLYGLQQSSAAGVRSNVACVNAAAGVAKTDPDGNPLPLVPNDTLEITYVNGETGAEHPEKDVLADLAPFEWRQIARPLEPRGITNGYAVVRKTSGDSQFLCYAVLNDDVNGDGSFVPMFVDDAPAPGSRSFVPVVLQAAGYQTEVTFTNRSARPLDALVTLVLTTQPDLPQYASISLKPGQQIVADDIMARLRSAGLTIPPDSIGSLFVQFEEGAAAARATAGAPVPFDLASLTARTFTVRQGGKFGLSYRSVPLGEAAESRAFVFGLQQTGERGKTEGTRSNLAVVNVAGKDEADVDLEITYFGPDGKQLGKQKDCAPCRLKPGEWRQFNAVLDGGNGFTAANAYARIDRKLGADQLFAYGILNDQLNDDGSYVPMVLP